MGNRILAFTDFDGNTKYIVSVKKRYNKESNTEALDYKVTDYFNKATLFKSKNSKKIASLFKEFLNKEIVSILPFEQAYYYRVDVEFKVPSSWYTEKFGFRFTTTKRCIDIKESNLELINSEEDSRMEMDNVKDINALLSMKRNFSNDNLAVYFIEKNKQKLIDFVKSNFKYIE